MFALMGNARFIWCNIFLLFVVNSLPYSFAVVYNFAVIPKFFQEEPYTDFFGEVRKGCESWVEEFTSDADHTVKCWFEGTESLDPAGQVNIVKRLIAKGSIQGLAISVTDESILTPVINEAVNKNVTVVTFDSDAPNSDRKAFIGTNQTQLGHHLSKVAMQATLERGLYGVISSEAANLKERTDSVVQKMTQNRYEKVVEPFRECNDNSTIALQIFKEYAQKGARIVIAVGGWPFRLDPESWKQAVRLYNNVTLVSADTSPELWNQIQSGNVDGLVGQLPFQMGYRAMQSLYGLVVTKDKKTKEFIFTDVNEVILAPTSIHRNTNVLSHIKILGYIAFVILSSSAIGFTIWTCVNRNINVVRASQPIFLYLLCFGTLIMSFGIILVSLENKTAASVACKTSPWFSNFGFNLIFSALISKLLRLNKIFSSAQKFKRVKVTPMDVMRPLAVLMTLTVVLLSMETIFEPSDYIIRRVESTDEWNRPLGEYGECSYHTNNGITQIFLLIIKLIVLAMVNMQAFKARNIQTEYNESIYITLVTAISLQVYTITTTVLMVANDKPIQKYLMRIMEIFLPGLAILLFIFYPKLKYVRESKRKAAEKEISKMRRKTDPTVQNTSNWVQTEMETETKTKTKTKSKLSKSLRKDSLIGTGINAAIINKKDEVEEEEEEDQVGDLQLPTLSKSNSTRTSLKCSVVRKSRMESFREMEKSFSTRALVVDENEIIQESFRDNN